MRKLIAITQQLFPIKPLSWCPSRCYQERGIAMLPTKLALNTCKYQQIGCHWLHEETHEFIHQELIPMAYFEDKCYINNIEGETLRVLSMFMEGK
jgi:hypothetical protein